MQRTCSPPGPRSSTNPPGVGSWADTSLRAAVSAACRSSASCVSAGIRPSGGSTISDVRSVVTDVPSSNQKSLYGTTRSDVSLSRLRRRIVSSAKFAACSAVNTSRSASSSGRCIGVRLRKSHTPCRSGAPHGSRGTSSAVCAPTSPGASHPMASTATTHVSIRSRMFHLPAVSPVGGRPLPIDSLVLVVRARHAAPTSYPNTIADRAPRRHRGGLGPSPDPRGVSASPR